MCERLFSDRKGKNSLFTNEEKLELAELVSKRKEEYDAEVARNVGKFKYDSKRKKHVPIKPTCGFLAKAVREFPISPTIPAPLLLIYTKVSNPPLLFQPLLLYGT